MKRLIKEHFDGLIDLFYPNLCVGCELESVSPHELFCISCEHKTSITNLHRLAQNECMRRVPSINLFRATSMYRFYPGGIIQTMIHQIKYANRPQVATRIGQKYGRMLVQEDWVHDVELIVPVPLHWKRLRRRGFNQSQRFAAGLAESLAVSISTDQLIRIKETSTQTQKGRYERLQNMMGAFQCVDVEHFTNKHVLLVDDVLTTGATLEACLTKISACSPAKLSFATIAIAE